MQTAASLFERIGERRLCEMHKFICKAANIVKQHKWVKRKFPCAYHEYGAPNKDGDGKPVLYHFYFQKIMIAFSQNDFHKVPKHRAVQCFCTEIKIKLRTLH